MSITRYIIWRGYENEEKSIEIYHADFFLCSIVEYVDFLVIKTDQTILAENGLCELFVLALIIYCTLAPAGTAAEQAVVMAVGYVLLAGILGYEWGLCAALTGTLWAGSFEHFFNNFLTDSLLMVAETGVDE